MRSPKSNYFRTSDGIALHFIFADSGKEKTLLFLHGFTGSVEDWNDIYPDFANDFNVLALDLVGHGKSESPGELKYYSADSSAKYISEIINYLNLNFLIIAGYSMGGRAAINYYFSFPQKVKGLILESASPGIENANEREARLINDLKLAEKIERNGIIPFIDEWMELPLFHTLKKLPDDQYQKIVSRKYSNNTKGLANSLRGFGQGATDNFWDRLSDIIIPVFLLSGEADEKYIEINKRVVSLIPNSEFRIVKSAGHNIHLQNRSEFINLTKQFLNNHF